MLSAQSRVAPIPAPSLPICTEQRLDPKGWAKKYKLPMHGGTTQDTSNATGGMQEESSEETSNDRVAPPRNPAIDRVTAFAQATRAHISRAKRKEEREVKRKEKRRQMGTVASAFSSMMTGGDQSSDASSEVTEPDRVDEGFLDTQGLAGCVRPNVEVRRLDLRHHVWLGPDFFEHLHANVPPRCVRDLRLGRCAVTSPALESLLHEDVCGSSLRVLDLSGCILVEDLSPLLECTGLRKLCLSLLSDAVTDEFLSSLAEVAGGLQALDLSYCTEVTDEGLKGLARGLVALVNLNLRGCTGVTDKGLVALASVNPLVSDLDVSLLHKEAVTDGGLADVVKSFKRLLKVDVSSTQAGGRSVQMINRYCKMVQEVRRSVRAARCPSLDGSAVSQLVKSVIGPRLLHLDISACSEVTPESILDVVNHAPSLNSLNVSMCPLITEAFIKALIDGSAFAAPPAEEKAPLDPSTFKPLRKSLRLDWSRSAPSNPKDLGLRLPNPPPSKKKKKGKGKDKKGKKK
uniref:F-box/LRR-repeat protein 15-like leucin rich repeat domain-containing protein n=1 Tax=Chromera velia CCMP2878 TaxID=1169474 RepID=A0A0G4I9F2_9ALVE|eukprot:Cvel_12249.t1-p1 / transcript=Cvel_12249.t1 / gene=Cvel_12249 / organism=Chromera_velia_CCMP2878 / gene_product=F-box/LRR-repeat protein 2, putative / transcript_product=F-box/LRR-repeat protein 2, putative / location=Cvel_scaffold793:26691-30742(+) / protein_length=515 / sequence_SO=supercontig / SO=protein_coding / is_pseudo=false